MNSKYTSYKLPLNWEKGMMLNQIHLDEFNDYIYSIYRNSMLKGMHFYNYGLLPNYENKFDSLILNIDKQGDKLTIKLEQLYALTFDGIFLNINSQIIKTECIESKNLIISDINLDSLKSKYILVYLAYDPSSFVNVGKEDSLKDNFKRKPYRNIAIQLKSANLDSISELNDNGTRPNLLPLALVDVTTSSNPIREKNYIPPSVNSYSNKNLFQIFDKLEKDTLILSKSLAQVLSYARKLEKGRTPSNLSIDLSFFLQNLLPVVTEIRTALKLKSRVSPLIDLCFLFEKLASTILLSYDSIERGRKQEMLNFFGKLYKDSEQLTKICESVVESQYHHVNIYHSSLKPILGFMSLISNSMEKLARTGLIQLDEFSNVEDIIVEKETNNEDSINQQKQNSLYNESNKKDTLDEWA